MFIGQLTTGLGIFTAQPPPVITSLTCTVIQDPDCSANDWRVRVDWNTNNGDDGRYFLEVYYCATNGCTPNGASTLLVSSQTTFPSTTTDATGITGLKDGTSNPVTSYRTYYAQIIRTADSFVVSTAISGQVSVTTGDCI